MSDGATVVAVREGGGGAILTVNLGGEGDFPSISAALQQACAGDIIRVGSGTYEEVVHVTQDVILEGFTPTEVNGQLMEGETLLMGALLLSATSIVKRISLRGMAEVRKGRVVLEDCDVQRGADGIRVLSGASATIRRCQVHDCASSGDGIYFAAGASGVVEDCDVFGCRVNGVHAKGAAVSVLKCRIRDCHFGIYFRQQAHGRIEGNTLEYIKNFAIYISERSDPVVQGNTTRESGIYGLIFASESLGSCRNNTIEGSVRIQRGCGVALYDNAITGRIDLENKDPIPV